MANVNFMRGLQNTLTAMTSWNEGTFYLTTDTNRLYFAQANDKLVDLNQYIQLWNSTTLPTTTTVPTLRDGDIYYLTQSNILAIRDSTATGGWTQLNPDTHLVDDSTGQYTVQVGAISGTENAVRVTTTVQDEGGNGGNIATGSFDLIAGNNNVTIENSGNAITISTANDNTVDTYVMGTQVGTSSGTTTTGILTLTQTHNGTQQTPQTVTITGSGTTSVTSTANGNITISSTGGVEAVHQTFDAQGNLNTHVDLEVGGSLAPAPVLPIIKYGDAGTTEAKFIVDANDPDATTGIASLSVYTKQEVDNLIDSQLATADALTYQGTVNQSTAANTLFKTVSGQPANTYNASVGEVYKASSDISVSLPGGSTFTANTGDLIIAQGTDGEVTWEVIPSGDDQLIDVEASSLDHTFKVYDHNDVLGGINMAGDNTHISIASAVDGSNVKTYTISHLAPTTGTAATFDSVVPAIDPSTHNANANATELNPATNAAGNSIDIPVITGMSVDSKGHVYSTTGKTYRVWDTHGAIDSLSSTISVSGNEASVSTGVVFDGQSSSTTFKLKTDQASLQLSAYDSTTVKLDLVWGTF